jgi:hypothetical protein
LHDIKQQQQQQQEQLEHEAGANPALCFTKRLLKPSPRIDITSCYCRRCPPYIVTGKSKEEAGGTNAVEQRAS